MKTTRYLWINNLNASAVGASRKKSTSYLYKYVVYVSTLYLFHVKPNWLGIILLTHEPSKHDCISETDTKTNLEMNCHMHQPIKNKIKEWSELIVFFTQIWSSSYMCNCVYWVFI